MSLFHRRSQPAPPAPFPPERFEPVLRSSICTGEKTACMRNRETGKLHEIMLIRSDEDLRQFGEAYGVDPEKIRTVY